MRSGRVAVAFVLLVVFLSGCSPAPPPDLVGGGVATDADPAVGISEAIGLAPRHLAVSPGSFICSPVDLTIDDVTLDDASSNLRLVRWGIASSGGYTDAVNPATLEGLLPGSTHQILQRCNGGRYAAVGLELLRTDDENAIFHGITLHYRVGDQEQSAYIRASMAVCTKLCPSFG